MLTRTDRLIDLKDQRVHNAGSENSRVRAASNPNPQSDEALLAPEETLPERRQVKQKKTKHPVLTGRDDRSSETNKPAFGFKRTQLRSALKTQNKPETPRNQEEPSHRTEPNRAGPVGTSGTPYREDRSSAGSG